MIQLKPRETVLLSENFNEMIQWYKSVLGFHVTDLFDDDFHYCNLETKSGIKIGIADANEMGVKPKDRSSNTVLLQFEVQDIDSFFTHLKQNNADITFGPSFDKKGQYWYGGFSDIEGNPIWVVDKNCP